MCYLVVLALTLGLLKPTKWTAKISANVIIEDFGAGTIDDLNRLATFYDGAQDSNESALEDLRNRYKAVHLVAGLTLVVWITLVWASV